MKGIVYVGKFLKGYRWMAEILPPNSKRVHAPVVLSKTFHHTQYNANYAGCMFLTRCGIKHHLSIVVGDNKIIDDDIFWDLINMWAGREKEAERKWDELAQGPQFISKKRRNLKNR